MLFAVELLAMLAACRDPVLFGLHWVLVVFGPWADWMMKNDLARCPVVHLVVWLVLMVPPVVVVALGCQGFVRNAFLLSVVVFAFRQED